MNDPTSKQTVTVVCEAHGLRYNPNVHSGCVRCRKASGELVGGASGSSTSSLAVALMVALALILGATTLFYLGHKATWRATVEQRELWAKDPEGLTLEQREQLRQLEERFKDLAGQ